MVPPNDRDGRLTCLRLLSRKVELFTMVELQLDVYNSAIRATTVGRSFEDMECERTPFFGGQYD